MRSVAYTCKGNLKMVVNHRCFYHRQPSFHRGHTDRKNKFIRLTIDDFLTPYKQMAHLCQLQWSGYVFSGRLSYASRHDEKELARMKEKSIRHAQLFYSSLRFFRL